MLLRKNVLMKLWELSDLTYNLGIL